MKPSNHNLNRIEIRKKAKMLHEICKFCGNTFDSDNFKAVCSKCGALLSYTFFKVPVKTK